MEVRVLGPVELITAGGDPVRLIGHKMRGLVAVLALHAGAVVSAQRLLDALWGERDVQGISVVHVVVSRLRRVLADAGAADVLTTRPAGYQLDLAPDAVDALRFEALVRDGGAAASVPADTVARLGTALSLWRGAALADAPATEAIDGIRARLEELRRVAEDELVDAELALGRHRQLAPRLEGLVAAEPLREHRWAQLMRALYGSGEQAEALRVFGRARATLVEQVGVEPGAELRQLEAAVLAQDPGLLGPSSRLSGAPVGDGFRRRGNLRHGHSFGGNAALEWCRTDERCRAAANLDGALWTAVGTDGLPRPALQILADHPEFAMSGAEAVAAGLARDVDWYDAEKRLTFDGWQNLHRLARPGSTARIGGASHTSFMDLAFLPLRGDSPVRGSLTAASVDPARAWRIMSDLLLDFFSTNLGGPASSVVDPCSAYDEVLCGPPGV